MKAFKKVWESIKDFVVFYIWDPIDLFFYNVKWFFKNLFNFRHILWEYRNWDYAYVRDLQIFGLKNLVKCLEHGHEEEVSRNKKIDRINELIKLLEHNFDSTIDIIEYEKIRPKRNKRIFEIMNGQNEKKLAKRVDEKRAELKEKDPQKYEEYEKQGFYQLWVEEFDGTGCESWWD